MKQIKVPLHVWEIVILSTEKLTEINLLVVSQFMCWWSLHLFSVQLLITPCWFTLAVTKWLREFNLLIVSRWIYRWSLHLFLVQGLITSCWLTLALSKWSREVNNFSIGLYILVDFRLLYEVILWIFNCLHLTGVLRNLSFLFMLSN